MPSFSQMKDMYRLQKEAKKVKQELKSIHVEAEGVGVQVVVSAEQEVVSVKLDPAVPHDKLEPALVDAFNRALKKSQVVATEYMKPVMEKMGISAGQA
jgi:DNA-binding protein YbaB